MKFLPPEPQVDLYNDGFGDIDILERKKVSKALSDLVERIDDPIVVVLDGKWGTGKTYFLKRWVGAHSIENEGKAITVYFDAFAHDYISDPLPALVSALSERLPKGNAKTLKKLKAATFKLAKPLARIGLAVATFGATEALGDLGDAAVEALNDESEEALKKYWERETGRRSAMIEFKKAIEALASSNVDENTGAALVFVIDELDRCRPDYALEVLEVIKHFFAAPHVHFILGVNLDALENSVESRYGSNINAHRYLNKFIQVSLELPAEIGEFPNSRKTNSVYLRHLIKRMEVPSHIAGPLINQVELVSKCNHVSLRDLGKIVSSISLANGHILNTKSIPAGHVSVMLDLIIAKNIRPDLFPRFLESTVTDDDLLSYMGATSVNVPRRIKGKHNQHCVTEISRRYTEWAFLSANRKLFHLKDEEDSVWKESAAGRFEKHGIVDAPSKLSRKIYKRYLARFSFYSDKTK